MVGMPATGLGGLFYILLVAWMAVREFWLVVCRRQPSAGSSRILSLGGMALAIVSALWFEGWLLHELFGSTAMPAALMRYTNNLSAEFALGAVAPMLTVAPFVLLGVLFGTVHVVRHLLERRDQPALRQGSVAKIQVRAR